MAKKQPQEWLNTIQCMDCVEGMKQLPDKCIDLVLTDPPYGIDFQSARRIGRLRKDKIANDNEPFVAFLPEVSRILKDGGVLLCFTRYDVENEFRAAIHAAGLNLYGQIIWDKVIHGMGDLNGDIAPQHENIIFARKPGEFTFPQNRPASVVRIQRVTADKLVHPNEKPVPLAGRLIIQFCKPEGIICDPFMGSGTTARACKDLGRNFIGFEISEKYCEIANKRLQQEVMGF